MQVAVTMALFPGETTTLTADAVATAILQAIGGDPAKDAVYVSITQAAERGSAGLPESPPA